MLDCESGCSLGRKDDRFNHWRSDFMIGPFAEVATIGKLEMRDRPRFRPRSALYLTNVAGLGGTNVTFAVSNSLSGAYSVEASTNLADWQFLGSATPRRLFTTPTRPRTRRVTIVCA